MKQHNKNSNEKEDREHNICIYTKKPCNKIDDEEACMHCNVYAKLNFSYKNILY